MNQESESTLKGTLPKLKDSRGSENFTKIFRSLLEFGSGHKFWPTKSTKNDTKGPEPWTV